MTSTQCPQLEKLPEQIRAFWQKKEAECNDGLVRFSYAVRLIPSGFVIAEQGGLLYLMERDLWFEDFPKSSMFTFLFQNAPVYEKTRIQIPVTTITQGRIVSPSEMKSLLFETPARSSRFQQILASIFESRTRHLFLSGTDTTGQPFRYAFRDIDDPVAWVHALTRSA